MTEERDPGGAAEEAEEAGEAGAVSALSLAADGAHHVPASPLTGSREPSLTLARVHLRLGSLSLARAELETLAGRDALDDAGLVDLLEARWRTGDLTGAGAIATLLLGEGEDGPLLALVVAAEAAAARGRPTEARRYATVAQALAGDLIDVLFAGMPRGSVWPDDAMALDLPGPTLFDEPRHGGIAAPPRRPSASGASGGAGDERSPAIDEEAPADGSSAVEPATIALWAPDDLPGEAAGSADPASGLPSDEELDLPVADEILATGRRALTAGDVAAAADQLGLALRFDPRLAPAILDAIGNRPDRALALVRGDAYRLLGREREARQAYAEALRAAQPASAASELHDQPHPEPDSDPTRHPPEGDPA